MSIHVLLRHVLVFMSLRHVLIAMSMCYVLIDVSLCHVLIDMLSRHVLTLVCQRRAERNRLDDVRVLWTDKHFMIIYLKTNIAYALHI